MGISAQNYLKRLLAALALASALTIVGCSDGGSKKASTGSSSSSSSTSSGTATSTKPEAFSFAAKTDVPVATAVSSEPATITGITAAAPVSISGGSYSIDGDAFTAEGGSITEGQTVAVQVQSPDAFSSSSTATLDVGGVTANFTVTTEAQDTSPEAFTFTDQTGVEYSAAITSMSVTISGINDAVPVTITGGEYQIGTGEFTSEAGTVTNNQTVTVRVTSSAKAEQTSSATLTVGDQTAAFNVTTKPDTVNPEVAIQFPPPASMTEGETIYIRGESSDLHSTVASLTVNGQPVATEDGYATWSVELPLAEGENTLSVMATDAAGNVSAAEAVNVRRAPITSAFPNDENPFKGSINADIGWFNDRLMAFVTDDTALKVFAVDLATGERTVASENAPEDTVLFEEPFDVSLGNGNKLYVTDVTLGAIFEVDLNTGEKLLVLTSSDSSLVSAPAGVVWEAESGRVLVTDRSRVYAVDVDARLASIVSGDGHPGSESPFSGGVVFGPVLDVENERLLVVQGSTIFSVNTPSGERSILGSFSPATYTDLSLLIPGKTYLLADNNSSSVYSYDVESQEVVLISGPQEPGISSPNALVDFWGLAVHPDLAYAVLIDRKNGLLAMDLETGQRVVLSKSATSL